jgi:hypothetical protein
MAPVEKTRMEVAAPASMGEGQRQSWEGTATETSDGADREHERRLIIRDVDGHELHEESGEFILEPSEGAAKHVPFRGGRFSLKGFPEGMVRIERATAYAADENRPVVFEEERFVFHRYEPTLLVGHYLPDCTLRVVDARTGASLSDVRVLPGHAGPEQSHPGPHFASAYVVQGEASPVRLPRTRGLQSYWVTARGYSWRSVLIDHESGGERVVEIEPAGRLLVEVHGDIDAYTQSLEAYIRVYVHATQSVVTSSGVGPRQGFDGVAAGTYDVRVELGSAYGANVLGETRVDVAANAIATARIELIHQRIPPPRVGVSGEIVLSRRHRTFELRPSLRIQPIDGSILRHGDALRIQSPHGPALRYQDTINLERGAMDGRYERDDGSEVFRWEAELSAGRYLFVVEPVQYGVVRDVPESPDAHIDIVLPELFPVTLGVVDARTRKPIDGATVRWSRHFAEERAGGWVEMDMEPGVESAIVYMAQGSFSLSARAKGYGQRLMDAYVGSGSSQLTLELSSCMLREIILVHGETVVPWGPGMFCSFRSLGSNDSHPCDGLGEGKMWACFEQLGLYEILCGKLEGSRELAPVVVEVSEGDPSPIVVQLED